MQGVPAAVAVPGPGPGAPIKVRVRVPNLGQAIPGATQVEVSKTAKEAVPVYRSMNADNAPVPVNEHQELAVGSVIKEDQERLALIGAAGSSDELAAAFNRDGDVVFFGAEATDTNGFVAQINA
jgi:hypothetical protein